MCSYNLPPRYAWDETKRRSNLAKHGVDFAAVSRFDWTQALVRADVRFSYGEVRLVALAPIGPRLHVLVYTVERRAVRVISLRPAGRKEVRDYATEKFA